MSSLFTNLGIDWRLLLSQAVNFALLLIILRLTIYKPLLRLMAKRREKIEDGLVKAEEAERRLRDVAVIQKNAVKQAEAKGLEIIKAAEADGEAARAKLLEKGRAEEAALMKVAEERIRAKAQESERRVSREAAQLVKSILVKTVELSPEAVDNALIEKAAKEARQ